VLLPSCVHLHCIHTYLKLQFYTHIKHTEFSHFCKMTPTFAAFIAHMFIRSSSQKQYKAPLENSGRTSTLSFPPSLAYHCSKLNLSTSGLKGSTWVLGLWCAQIYLLIAALYKMFACLLEFPTYLFVLIYSLSYLSTSFRIGPLRFQAGCRKRRLNLTSVFCDNFMLL